MNENQGLNDFLNVDYQTFSDFLFSFTGNEFALVGSLIGYFIGQDLTADKQSSLGNFFELIGQVLLTISSQNQVILNKYNNIMRLNQLFDATANEMDRQEMLDSEVMQRAYHIIKAKYQELKEERSAVYAELVANNSTTSKWKSEQQVYAIVREKYDDAIYQFHADWLGRQSLDVYIPSLNLAIEYQGQQHYEPLEIFGGKEKFNLQQQQDLKKKKLCAENNIILVEWKYDIKPSKRNLNELLKPYIK